MKNVTMNLTIAAAAFLAVAGVASAQTMEAKIPFAFRTSDKVFAAGTYRVQVESDRLGNKLVLIRSRDSGDIALAMGFPNGAVKKEWESAGNAVLSFQCGVSRCALHEIWMGGGPAYLRPT